jgi:hypothetical protein
MFSMVEIVYKINLLLTIKTFILWVALTDFEIN